MIEIVPQNIDKLSISSIEKIYGSKIKLFNNDIEINNLKNIHEDEFYIMYSYSKDVICSLYLDKFQCQYMNGFKYLSDENIFALDINKIFEINFSLNKENSNGLGLYIVKNILFNYGIKYKVEKSEIGIVFLIELSGNMDK